VLTQVFQLTLIKTMIATANADGHIDATERQAIFKGIGQMELSTEMKSPILDLLCRPIAVHELLPRNVRFVTNLPFNSSKNPDCR
jgi:uncharacterized membrane protein YebE (DUF533 family)